MFKFLINNMQAKIAAREVRQGVIYVDFLADTTSDVLKDFDVAFGKAFNFTFEEHITFSKQLLKIFGDVNGELINIV